VHFRKDPKCFVFCCRTRRNGVLNFISTPFFTYLLCVFYESTSCLRVVCLHCCVQYNCYKCWFLWDSVRIWSG